MAQDSTTRCFARSKRPPGRTAPRQPDTLGSAPASRLRTREGQMHGKPLGEMVIPELTVGIRSDRTGISKAGHGLGEGLENAHVPWPQTIRRIGAGGRIFRLSSRLRAAGAGSVTCHTSPWAPIPWAVFSLTEGGPIITSGTARRCRRRGERSGGLSGPSCAPPSRGPMGCDGG